MNTERKIKATGDRKAILSTLWIFLMVNYIYCDVFSNMEAGVLKEYLTGQINGLQITQGFLIQAALLMEIPMALIVLSRVLKYGVNRWVNIIAGLVMVAIQIGSLAMGSNTIHYIFYSTIEITCNLFIVWYAWKWRPEAAPVIGG